MSGSYSQSDQETSSSTTSVADSYNQTYNRVANISENVTNSGNVIFGLPGDSADLVKAALPWIFGVVAVLGAVIFLRR